MPKYLCLQRSLPSGGAERPSPSEMQEMYSRFGEWMEKYKSNLVDRGGQLGAGRIIAHGSATDGPFAEVKDLVGGYMIVSAETLDAAADVARECPGLVSVGSGVEVIEIHGP